MSILWCGGEDIDFPNGSAVSVSTVGSLMRSGYARCSLFLSTAGLAKSTVFPGGAVSSAWLSCRIGYQTSMAVQQKTVGFGLSGGNSGIFVGSDSSITSKLALCKYDGTTTTQLAAETGNSLAINTLRRLDLQVVGPLSTATINVYLDGVLLITYSGNLSAIIASFDSIYFVTNTALTLSEIVVADEDTRSFPGLMTMALTGNGTTNDWSPAAPNYTNIYGTTISDASPTYTNTSAKDEQYNVTDLPSGSFVIKAVKIAARMALAAGAVTKVSLGYNSGGSVAFGTGAQKTLTTAYTTYEQLDAVNPVTGVAFVQSDMNALQLDLRSAT